jgi:hypothetical protein
MKSKQITFLFLAIATLFVVSAFTIFKSHLAHAYSTTDIVLSSSDISNAGYTDVTEQQPQDEDYQPPAQYFWVDSDSGDTTNVANLLMVSIYHQNSAYTDPLFSYGSSRQPFAIQGGTGEEAVLNSDTRTAINFSKGDYYVVIIGPTAANVEALAAIVAGKI